jgi:acylphosphatase
MAPGAGRVARSAILRDAKLGPVMVRSRRVRVRVSGRVQGVFFRAACAERARREGLGGWVRNLPGGDVEAAFEGTPNAVEALITWCRSGPQHARVDRIEVVEEPVTGDDGFRVQP